MEAERPTQFSPSLESLGNHFFHPLMPPLGLFITLLLQGLKGLPSDVGLKGAALPLSHVVSGVHSLSACCVQGKHSQSTCCIPGPRPELWESKMEDTVRAGSSGQWLWERS